MRVCGFALNLPLDTTGTNGVCARSQRKCVSTRLTGVGIVNIVSSKAFKGASYDRDQE